ncbi:hypothetical protein CHS0354_024917 [Potamilus streckersoni]|uniref:Uncharacterized protein n=1 Tax=Potamilus streckersoni TaxID=2493646 RepID=A0AAE0S4F4_9BIVA|nr:hypothetical protein CHS0354_024917 [Potamilus streckersoni]
MFFHHFFSPKMTEQDITRFVRRLFRFFHTGVINHQIIPPVSKDRKGSGRCPCFEESHEKKNSAKNINEHCSTSYLVCYLNVIIIAYLLMSSALLFINHHFLFIRYS